MSKKRRTKGKHENKRGMSCDCVGVIDEKTLTLAIVKAYQIIENERKLLDESNKEKPHVDEQVVDIKWYVKILFMLNVLLWPWKINRRFKIKNNIYDGVLVLFVTLVMGMVGVIIWMIGLGAIAYGIVALIQGGGTDAFIGMLGLGLLLMLFGSLFTLAGNEFSKVSDSNKIYAYSASIIALISCILTVISMMK